MPGIIKDAWDWATTSPEFVKKRVKQAHESVEPRSVFDSTLEKYGKPAIHAAIDTADTFATPLDAAGVLAGGAGFMGGKLYEASRMLPKVSNMEHYIDAIKLGKTHPEAVKIATSGARNAADRARKVAEIEDQFGYGVTRHIMPKMSSAPVAKAAKKVSGPVRQAAGKGKSVIDLAESVRKNARKPYTQTTRDIEDRWEAIRRAQQSRGKW